MKFVYLGHDRLSVYENMALDEVMLSASKRTGECYIRFSDFKKPSLILAYVEHPSDLIRENVSGLDVTRRLSQGGIMLCDNSTIAYSITVPIRDFTGVHRYLGGRIGEAVKKYVDDVVEIGDHFSLRISGNTIAGHGQRNSREWTLYHGVLAFEPWDFETINKTVRMSENEREFVRNLRSLRQYNPSAEKFEVMTDILESVTEGRYIVIDAARKGEMLKEARLLAETKYMNPEWIEYGTYWDSPPDQLETRKNTLLRGWGFCFSDVGSPEPNVRPL